MGSVALRSLISSEDYCTICSVTTTNLSEVLLCHLKKKKDPPEVNNDKETDLSSYRLHHEDDAI